MSFEKTTPYPPDRKERYHKRSEIVAKVEEKRLPSVENITKMQEVMFEKFGLLPEDLCEPGSEEEKLIMKHAVRERDEDLLVGAIRGKYVETFDDGTRALVKTVDSDYQIAGMKKGDLWHAENDPGGRVRLRIFRENVEPGTYLIRERFARIFATMTGFSHLTEPNAFSPDRDGKISLKTKWNEEATVVSRTESYDFFQNFDMENTNQTSDLIEAAIFHGLLSDSDKGQHTGNILAKRQPGSKKLKTLKSIDHSLVLTEPWQHLTDLPNKLKTHVVNKLGNDKFGEPVKGNFHSMFLQKMRGHDIPEKTLQKLKRLRDILDEGNELYQEEREQLERFMKAMNPAYDHLEFNRKYVDALLQTKKVLSYNDLLLYKDPEYTGKIMPTDSVETKMEQYLFADEFEPDLRSYLTKNRDAI